MAIGGPPVAVASHAGLATHASVTSAATNDRPTNRTAANNAPADAAASTGLTHDTGVTNDASHAPATVTRTTGSVRVMPRATPSPAAPAARACGTTPPACAAPG